ncbi:DUF892 family protein [Haloferula sp. BvORR071]|uniref:YciE/YciF ferroxidase family protein n=1 Tax=Haloferula sp. BvORR071 TaxID=1396141 RepID=UPI00054D8F28|nr:DUF892 family protein [Haloferula sp. BvORR071]
MKNLNRLFLTELGICFSSEARLGPALFRMAETTASLGLKRLIRLHGQESEWNVKHLEGIFEACGEKARGKRCEAIAGILADGEKLTAGLGRSPIFDAALIAIARKIGHWQIASYASLGEWADLLAYGEVAEVLNGILDKKKAMGKSLAAIARSQGHPEGPEKPRVKKVAG